MKFKLLLVLAIFTCGFSIAQINTPTKQIFDMDFEHWTNKGSYSDPDSLQTTNQYTSLAGAFLVTKGTDAYHGAASLKLTSTLIQFFTINGTYPGVVSNGTINAAVLSGGAGAPIVSGKKIDYRPSHFSAFYKNSTANHDSSMINIWFTKWNAPAGKRDTVGNMIWFDTTQHPTYTHLLQAVNYFTADIPDTFQVTMLSSGLYHSNVGSVLTIDSMNFTPDTASHVGLNVLGGNALMLNVYPNPSNQTLNYSYAGLVSGGEKVSIYTMSGELIYSSNLKTQNSIDIASWKAGMYVYQVADKNGQLVAQGNFAVQH
jgi:hypothetical protein